MNKILVLAGPTASGKTEVSCALSQILPLEMISCDSMQVYRSMPILSQAPPRKICRALGAHLVGFLPPDREYSAAQFREDAESLLPQIFKRKRIPLIVGGTGLYLRALLDGLFEAGENMPPKDEAFRRKLEKENESRSPGHLHAELKAIDPLSASKIHPRDTRRLIRALEVYHLTRKTLSSQKSNRRGIREKFPPSIFLLERERDELYGRINRRVDAMLKEGLADEVKRLLNKKLSQTASMALGIKEMRAYLEKRRPLFEAAELLKKNTRNYAKRQLSWFRHEKGVQKIIVGRGETAKETAKKIARAWEGAA
ncbi:MAG: tRNA (adenosine(37)-N6)-dimethylallyltransferase MiaA [Candidatus Omnitrophica bacterium]|nr:tRNA (adenosine(37)-N6)-dimethylallyltransferase MiaA [Candidatus Omnitrophota bacterium]